MAGLVLTGIPFLNAGPINAAFSGSSTPSALALRNVNFDWLRPEDVADANQLNVIAYYISLDSSQSAGVFPEIYELGLRYYRETCGPLMNDADYLGLADAREHIASVVREILRGAPSRSGRAVSASLIDETRRLYTDIHGLPAGERVYRDGGGPVNVALLAPPQAVGDWAGWGAGLTFDQVVGFLVLAAGTNNRRCAARHVDWVKAGIVYIWYSLMFAGTANPRKFAKFVSQCGLSIMDCPFPTANGVLALMSSRMTAGFDRARFTAVFDHMADQTAIEVLGLKNMVTQGRFHGMTNIVMIVSAMKECPTFEWSAVRMMWPGEFIAFHAVLTDLMDATHHLNPWGGFGNMVEKTTIRSTQFKCLSKVALDIQSRFMGNTTIAALQSFGTRAIYGKWANTVDTLMTNYETWVNVNHAAANIIANAAAIPVAETDRIRNIIV